MGREVGLGNCFTKQEAARWVTGHRVTVRSLLQGGRERSGRGSQVLGRGCVKAQKRGRLPDTAVGDVRSGGFVSVFVCVCLCQGVAVSVSVSL